MVLESLDVSLGDRSYPIHIGRDLAPELAEAVAGDRSSGRKLAVITDANVASDQAGFLKAAFGDLPVLVLPAGEPTKCFKQLECCCDFLAGAGLDRGGRLFAVGGGVIGDLAGFAAAAFFRGIGFYQVPTSLLAMVDSSVGGKTGINLECGKNLVGAFHQIVERIMNLEDGQRLDASSAELPAVIRRNCAIKAGVVSDDEREQAARGGRALLNLGHTFGHAIEAVAGYGSYLHGEAVAIGLVLACRLSEQLGMVEAGVARRAAALLEKYALPVKLRQPLPVDSLLAAAAKDKKARAGRLRYVALECIGKAVTVEDVEEALVRGLWEGLAGD